MSVSLNLSRNNCIQIISNAEVEKVAKASIDHFAIPLIFGLSMDLVSQEEYEEMGGRGKKPEPLSSETKLAIYNRMNEFFKSKILNKTAELVNSVLQESFDSMTDEELLVQANALTEKSIDVAPDWNIISSLFKDHTCLFKELEAKSPLKANLISFHDVICPLMEQYRDSGELFKSIKLKKFLL